jgi:AbrB family looped-hinge helix DNA binding protein
VTGAADGLVRLHTGHLAHRSRGTVPDPFEQLDRAIRLSGTQPAGQHEHRSQFSGINPRPGRSVRHAQQTLHDNRGQLSPRVLGYRWYRFPLEAVIDQAGRIVLPKPIRDALGLLPGTKVDITPYGAGAQLVPTGRTARLVEEDGVLVAAGETPVDDDAVFALIDAGRK